MLINYIFMEVKASKYLEFIKIFTDGLKQTSGRVGAVAYIQNTIKPLAGESLI